MRPTIRRTTTHGEETKTNSKSRPAGLARWPLKPMMFENPEEFNRIVDSIMEDAFPQLSPKNRTFLKCAFGCRLSLFWLVNVPREMLSDGGVINCENHTRTGEAVFMEVCRTVRESDIVEHVTAEQWQDIEKNYLSAEIFRDRRAANPCSPFFLRIRPRPSSSAETEF